ncbi:MAG: flagellar biosynthetic protein FliO [Candidatus Margulisiibacteriota bacterium]|jgi:flagellar biogenesis protein FliO
MKLDKDNLKKIGVLSLAVVALLSMMLISNPVRDNIYFSVLKMFFVLVLMAGVAYYVLKYANGGAPKIFKPSLKILEKIGLEAGVAVYVLEKDEQRWLIGVGNKQISLLDHLDPLETDFADILDKAKNRSTKKKKQGPAS